jgi:hypothetical protein
MLAVEVIDTRRWKLVIQIVTDHDDDEKLAVSASGGGFAGTVATWSWDGGDLQRFGRALQAYPD